MRLANVKLPPDLEAELKNTSARLGVPQSVLHRASLRAYLSTDPSREDVLHLDGVWVDDLRAGSAERKASSLLERLS